MKLVVTSAYSSDKVRCIVELVYWIISSILISKGLSLEIKSLAKVHKAK